MTVNTPKTVELDVRPHLKKKLEPFQLIMEKVKTLNKEDTFILHATFKPTPLLGLLKTKGYANKVEQIEAEHWIVTFVHKSRKAELGVQPIQMDEKVSAEAPSNTAQPQPDASSAKIHKLDNRGLQPPQPMVRTLTKLEASLPGEKVIIHNDRVPMFLIEELNTLGYPFNVEEQDDGTAIVTIEKK